MQRLEFSCAVRHIYIYIIRRQRVKMVYINIMLENSNNNSLFFFKQLKTVYVYVAFKYLCTNSCSSLIQIGSRPFVVRVVVDDVTQVSHFVIMHEVTNMKASWIRIDPRNIEVYISSTLEKHGSKVLSFLHSLWYVRNMYVVLSLLRKSL